MAWGAALLVAPAEEAPPQALDSLLCEAEVAAQLVLAARPMLAARLVLAARPVLAVEGPAQAAQGATRMGAAPPLGQDPAQPTQSAPPADRRTQTLQNTAPDTERIPQRGSHTFAAAPHRARSNRYTPSICM